MTALRPDKSRVAGLRRTYRNPLTGGWNGVYDGEAAGMDTEAGRWQTVCEEHGTVISHATKRLAREFGPHAEEWCEECMALAERQRPLRAGDIVTLTEPHDGIRIEVETVNEHLGIIRGFALSRTGERIRTYRGRRFQRITVPEHEVVR